MRKTKTGRLAVHILLAWVALAAVLPWYLGVMGARAAVAPQTGQVEAAVRGAEAANRVATAGDKVEVATRPVAAATGTARRSAPSRDEVLLAMAIHGEARGEPFIGQVAVGAVILNRVESGRFPDSIGGVIYQPGAFTAVADGQINLPPDEEAFRAARAALNGWDPSGGALYYYNPAKSSSPWIWSRPVIKKIGRHVFAA